MTYSFHFMRDGVTQDKSTVMRANPDGSVSSIPITQDNTNCIHFLTGWKAGEEVLNADGSPAPYTDDAVRNLGLDPL